VLQCVAVCCNLLPRVAVCRSASQCAAVCPSASQYVAVCCSVLQCVAVCCSAQVSSTCRSVSISSRKPCNSYCNPRLSSLRACSRSVTSAANSSRTMHETTCSLCTAYNCCSNVRQCVVACCSALQRALSSASLPCAACNCGSESCFCCSVCCSTSCCCCSASSPCAACHCCSLSRCVYSTRCCCCSACCDRRSSSRRCRAVAMCYDILIP